jgi:acyl phosphate:glycerol-3-phosphate acyltransferase
MKTAIILVICYLLGSIPFGLLWVKVFTGKDVRTIASGRTGGTNAMRAGGFGAGFLTALMDILKGFSTYGVVMLFGVNNPWVRIAAALAAVIGHNYSIFLLHRDEAGKLKLRGGAGGATALGGTIALWPAGGWMVLPLSILVFLFIGYASVTTMSIAFFSTLIFLIRVLVKAPGAEWAYVIYGLLAEALLIYALRPNIKRLREGNERVVGFRAYRQKKQQEKTPSSDSE